MRLLLNENFPGEAVDSLKKAGHDVVWIREVSPGITDKQVPEKAQTEGRIILTFDKDFGELAFRNGLSNESGIILFRITLPSAEHIARITVAALDERDDWSGFFSVVEEDRIRMTPLQPST